MTSALAATFLAAAVVAPFPIHASEELVVVIPHATTLAFAEAARNAQALGEWARDFSHDLNGSLGAMFAPRLGGKVVKGAPYSAEVVTENNQSLADGNVISRTKKSRVWRDGEGRTRQETGGDGKAASVFIFDPVDNRHHVLRPGARRAITTAVAPKVFTYDNRESRVVRVGSTEIRMEDGKLVVNGKEVKVRDLDLDVGGKKIRIENGNITIDGKDVLADARRHVEVRTIESSDSPDGTRREEIRVQVIRPDEPGDGIRVIPIPPAAPTPPAPPAVPGVPGVAPTPPAPPAPPLPGVHNFRFESTARLGPGVTTSLGMKEFDGVRAEGKSTTWTIPAGKIGNRNPILIQSETWYSPELQVTVYSRYSDPRTGESIYRLAHIRRGEPDPALFKVPEDYRVKSRARG